MKIGILTFHRVHNYGALLQAIGLRQYLQNNGYEAYFIDYWPEYHKKRYNAFKSYDFSKAKFKSVVKGILEDIFLFPLKIRRINNFNRFIDSYIAPYCAPDDENFDCVICGSDQIWGKHPELGNTFDGVYFGKGDYKTDFYISYAGSMGELNVSEEEKDLFKNLLANFYKISVREDVLVGFLKELGIGQETVLVADPTILYGASEWHAFIGKQQRAIKEDYVLYYKLADFAFDEDRIRLYAKERGLKLVILEGRIRRDDYFNGSITDANPMEMLNLIVNSSYVFTSSYHGLVFSLLFEKQVCCAFTKNSTRALSLLEYLNIPDRLVNASTIIPKGRIDYTAVSPILERLGKESRIWLEQALDVNCSISIQPSR